MARWCGANGSYRFFTLLFALLLQLIESKDLFDMAENELTITLQAGRVECFHQPAKEGQVLEVEYQVLDSNFGNMDVSRGLEINFFLKSPTDQELVADYRRADAVHRHEVKQPGDYTMCFDNSISTVSSKTVYFEVYIDSDSDEEKWDPSSIEFSPELVYNETMNEIKATIKKVQDNLNRVEHFQDQKKASETRDRNLQEHNFTRVNNFSILFIVVMLAVGAVQVVMIRSLFDERSKLHKIFKQLS
ncbi:transmembrane emp24 domain-containing protein 1-like [Ornithodoros turicata]|uniref:transmembrane emp24 domain-containing protein 1-like n=1 Tax=Ornithodoros turicata TaxID=34597 RepID=UPI003138BA55